MKRTAKGYSYLTPEDVKALKEVEKIRKDMPFYMEGRIKNPPADKSPPRRIKIAFEVVTPESAERGDIDEEQSGWENEEGVPMASVKEAIEFLRNEGAIMASSSGFIRGVWYHTEPSTDIYTGNSETRQFFLHAFTEKEEERIYNVLFSRHGSPTGGH